ncbi:ribonuclease domain-containing protein [Noviluteimonas dokdonensis]|uniref:ribonuclease domain-containing protein n=1 Tax=Noviluteimonas dokdonensis TaxID=414050 RepID=UPI00055C36BA|nr:ribonuclease domain-containing protein [Lysobacter dokdonensis]
MRNPWVWVVAAILLALWLFWPRTVNSPAPGEAPPSASAPARGGVTAELVRNDAPALPAFLPVEARDTVALIQRGGPFPHPQDGSVFQNRERHLPDMPRGFYREYTVDTPGLDHRGARRIVTGGQPPSTWYYTDDHYDSFRSFDVAGRMQ